jgi:hypothetical protein
VPAHEAEAALAALFAAGAQGVHEDGTALVTHFPPEADIESIATAVRRADPGASVTLGRTADTDWSEAWKNPLSVRTVGDLLIAPPGSPPVSIRRARSWSIPAWRSAPATIRVRGPLSG